MSLMMSRGPRRAALVAMVLGSGAIVWAAQQPGGQASKRDAALRLPPAGPVRAAEYVELLPKARVTGNVSYKSIEIHVGAIVMGQLVYETPPKSEKVIELKPHSGNSD